MNDFKKRTKIFAHRCVKLALTLPKNDFGYHIKGQLIRCSTSVPANYRASCVAQTKPAFIAKLSIVVEEADESDFWLEFLIDEKLMDKKLTESLMIEAKELTSIFISSRITAEKNKHRN